VPDTGVAATLRKSNLPFFIDLLAGSESRSPWAPTRQAQARISQVVDKVAKPTVARYAWETFPLAKLYNQEDLPCFPFRFKKQLEQYRYVYAYLPCHVYRLLRRLFGLLGCQAEHHSCHGR
jgi:hypothetical protein